MQTITASSRKRPVNLTLNEALVQKAKTYTDNLSATMEQLLSEYVAREQEALYERQQAADACAAQWNAFLDDHGSFAQEYCTL